MSQNKPSNREVDRTQKKEPWNHSSSKKEVNALKAMMYKNAHDFKKKTDEQELDEQEYGRE